MNPQPYQTPPTWWPSRLSPTFVKATRWWRQRDLQRIGILEVQDEGASRISESLLSGAGVLILPNHSFHYDSHTLIEAGLRNGWCAHFMTAWQVFALTGTFGKLSLQRHGCFSINREGTDTKAIRQAIGLLSSDPHPVVIFPEGDIYHSNDRVMPFREGAAAIALKAQKSASRPIHVYPTVMKCFYTEDPTTELVNMMNRLEHHIRWRPRPDLPLLERIYRFGKGFLALKEIEYLGATHPGELPERLGHLARHLLDQVRAAHGLKCRGNDIVDQIRNVRSFLIREIEQFQKELETKPPSPQLQLRLQKLQHDMDDMFFVTQLSSYRGNYTVANPTIERLAETIDKFEEDIFELQYPTPRGKRKAIVKFGDLIDLSLQSYSAAELTQLTEMRVQDLMDELNSSHRLPILQKQSVEQ